MSAIWTEQLLLVWPNLHTPLALAKSQCKSIDVWRGRSCGHICNPPWQPLHYFSINSTFSEFNEIHKPWSGWCQLGTLTVCSCWQARWGKPTKVHLLKVMVFPVAMYRCESWTIKKAEPWRIGAFELWCWRILLRVPWRARSDQSTLKEINPEYSFEGLMLKLKLQYFDHLM